MRTMSLERCLVKILWNENLKRGIFYNIESFVDLVKTKKWPRWRYFCLSDQQFENMIRFILEDCIKYGYIISAEKLEKDEEISHQKIKVSKGGRDFVKWFGFCEECLKRRKRTLIFIGALIAIVAWIITNGAAVKSAITWIIVYFWPYISGLFS